MAIPHPLLEVDVPDTLADALHEPGELAAVARVVRLATGSETAADREFVARAARTWIDADGAIPWERCLHLPTTPDAFRCMRRDEWLCEAAKLSGDASAWGGSAQLADDWANFLARGPWRDWRDDAEPPQWATPLARALFFASRLNRGKSLAARQVHRITRHIFEAKR